MQFQLEQAMEVLSNTPKTLRCLLTGLSKPWVSNNYGKDTFSPYDVVGHLIEGERNDWIQRMHIILEQGESRPFEKFNRFAMYEQSQGKTLENLLDEFEKLRAKNLADLRGLKLTDEQLEKRGTHPSLGKVTLRNLLSTWVVHDLNHLHQIAKCMAYQYRDEVGPWKEYLPLLSLVQTGR